MAKKRCSSCGSQKELDDFHALKKSKDGRQSYCKDCMKERSAVKNWERQGIDMTPSLRSMMDEANEYGCAICGRKPEEVAEEFKDHAVDHNHRSTKVRSLLCQPCNTAIGLFGEDPERMRTAAEYVEFFLAADELVPDEPKPTDKAVPRSEAGS